MRRLVPLLALAAALLAPSQTAAQSDQPRVYMMYFTVDLPDIPKWIESYQRHEVPLLDSLKEEGRLLAYDVWVHDTGGQYNLKYNLVLPNWGAIGDFMDAYFARLEPASVGEWLSMIQQHTDEIWVLGDSHIPEGRSDSPIMYESSFHIDYGKQGQWGADFEKYGKPALERAMEDGPLLAWASLHHDTGGPWNVKYVYWLEDWDQVDDLLRMLGEARREMGMDAESARTIRAHADDIWRAVPRSGN